MAFEGLSEKLQNVFKKITGKGKLSEADIKEAMREVKLALLEADVNFIVVKKFVKTVSEKCMGAEVMESLTPGQQVIKIVHEEMINLLGGNISHLKISPNPPTVILMAGLQGAGKTTMCGKLAKYFITKGKRPLLVACDIYRPAAIDQLKVVGSQAGADVFSMGQEKPYKIYQAAKKQAINTGNDIMIIDTAGRLHIDEDMMAELKKLRDEANPDETLLVIDAMTGQDAVNAAKAFNEEIELSGVIMTKIDGDTRGGAALSVKDVTGKPIKFVGTGEKLDDIEPFHPDRFASRILGMGDVLTLIEKAEQALDEKKAIEMEQKLRNNTFDLNDFLDQMEQMSQMGGIEEMLKMMPGGNKLSGVSVDEKQMSRTKAIIQSMTMQERRNPKILNASRRRRIAAGSGTAVQDVNRLMNQFEQMNKLIKQLSGKGGKKRRRGGFMGMGGFPF